MVKLFDKMLFEFKGSQRTVSIVGCDTFDELVGRVLHALRLDIPEKFVKLYSKTTVQIPSLICQLLRRPTLLWLSCLTR